MKFKTFSSLLTLWAVLGLAILPPLAGSAAAQTADPKPETTPASTVAPAPVPAPEAPAVEKPVDQDQAPAVVATPADAVKADVEDPKGDETPDDKKMSTAGNSEATPESTQPESGPKGKKPKHLHRVGGHGHHNSDNARVSIFDSSTLAAGEKADAVVSVFGSSTSAGEVNGPVVSVFGSSTSSGDVNEGVVSVVGNTRVTGGKVGDVAVSVMGSTYVNTHVEGDVVAVGGNVELGPDAVVDGDLVCVGGEVTRDPKAILHGNVQNVAVGGHFLNFDGLSAWISRCLLYGRPLAFGHHLMWAWWVALAYLAFYAFLALVAPNGINKCVQTLEERPGKSILAGLLTLLLTPVVFVLITLTVVIVIGVALIPIFSLGLFFAGLFGKAVMLAWLGRRITKLFGSGQPTAPVLAVLVGGIVVLLLYTIPILGFVVYKLLGVLGLGVVLYTLLLSIKSNRAAARLAVPVVPVVPPVVGDPAVPLPLIASLPPVISAATLPRAGFWIRVGASFLDFIMVAMIVGLLHGIFGWFIRGGDSFPLWFAIYNVVMWRTKGTTVGGIVCGLKVVRLDDRPIDWGVAIVRGLSAFLSLCVAGLGFIWVAFDDDKQSWHDKIAGTTIVRVPKGTSLL